MLSVERLPQLCSEKQAWICSDTGSAQECEEKGFRRGFALGSLSTKVWGGV